MCVCLSAHWRVCPCPCIYCICACISVCKHARACASAGWFGSSCICAFEARAEERQNQKCDRPHLVPAIFTVLANDTQRNSLEATNAPVSKLTRSATHVSNNQATFQPLDSGDPSTLYSLSLSLCSFFSSSSLQPAHQSAQNSSLKHYIIRHSSFILATP